ncbi:MAG: glycosyltransferase family 4 protein [Thermoleophilia bacterium]
MRRRLVILTPHDLELGAGGVERFTRVLAPLMRERGWDTDVFWPLPGDRAVPGPVEKIGAAVVVAARRVARRHRRAIAAADAVLANGPMGWSVRHPNLVTVFHANFAGYAEAVKPTVSRAEYVRLRHVQGGAMALAAARGAGVEVSRQNAREVTRYYGVRRVAVIENGIEPGSFAGGDAQRARRRHGLPDGRLVLFPGRVEYRKGEDALRALPALLPPDATLVVAGPRALDQPGAVDLGPQGPDELRDLYAAASVGLMPTRFEGCSYSLMEAQDAGLPVVTNRQGHVADMLEREPALAPAVASSLDPAELAGRVRLFLDDPGAARRVAEAGVRYVRRHHDAREMADRYDALLRGAGAWRRGDGAAR